MTLFFLVRIEYKEPEAVAYKNMKSTEFPSFLKSYPDKALSNGLKVSKIRVEKEYEIYIFFSTISKNLVILIIYLKN